MSPSRSSIRVMAFTLIALLLLAACGSKGPLVKPAPAPEAPKTVPITPIHSTPAPTSDADGH